MATASETAEIIKLYVGYYNRAPDPLGLNFWVNAFDNGFSLDDMAVDFSTQDETLANYPFFENEDPSPEDYGTFVDSVYQNLFNRNPDEIGKNFWVEKLDSGEFSVGKAISLIIEGATTSPDQDVVANKVAVGFDFYNDLNPVAPLYEFQEPDIAEATAIQAGVTENPATIATAAARTDEYVENFDDGSGRTINLTDETDVPGGIGDAADTQGGSGNDIYQATAQEFEQGTLQSADSIAAGGGDDTLNVRLVTGLVTTLDELITLNATDLENIVITNQVPTGARFELNLEAVTGEQELTVSGGDATSNIVYSNVDEGTSLRMVDLEGVMGVQFKGDRTASTDDSYDLYVENSGTTDTSARLALTVDGRSGRDETFETANITVGGSQESFIDLFDHSVENIVVTGSQLLHVEDTEDRFEELQSFDASSMSGGGITLDARDTSDAAFVFTGSDFDDSLMFDNDALSSSSTLTLNAGDGTDTLIVDNFRTDTVASINRAEGFEILTSSNASNTLVADDYNDIDTFVFAGQSTTGNRLNIRDVRDDDTFIFETDAGRTDEFIRFEAGAVGQSLTFEMRATSEDDGQIEFVAEGNNNSASAIGFTGNSTFDEVTIHSTGMNEDANLIQSLGSNGNFYAFDNSSGPTNFNITGEQALTITAAEGVELTSSDNERGFRESVNLDGSAATGDLRIAGSGVNDAIAGGSGDDILYGLGGDDMLTGNDGADQFRFTNWSGTDEIIDFTSGEDVIGLNRIDFNNTTATQEGAVLSTDDYIENLQAISSIGSGEDGTVIEMQISLSQSQIESSTGSSVASAYMLVFNSTTQKGELWFDSDWSTDDRQHVATFDDVDSLVELQGFSNTDFVEYLF